jgi:hypothetical protein
VRKIICLLGLPGSGKTLYGDKLAKEFGYGFVKDPVAQLIHKKGVKPGKNAPFEFDRAILDKNIETAKDALRMEKPGITIIEGGPVVDMLFASARSKLGKQKDSRRGILDGYNHQAIQGLMENSKFVFFNIPPGISLNRQEESNRSDMMTPELDVLEFVYKGLMEFYRNNKGKAVMINIMGKNEDVVYAELKQKIDTLLQD